MESVCTSNFTVLPYFVHKPLFTSNTHPKQFQHMQKRDPHRGNTQPTQPPHSSNTVPKQPPHSFHTASTQLPHSPRTSPTQANPAKSGRAPANSKCRNIPYFTMFVACRPIPGEPSPAKSGENIVCVGTCAGPCVGACAGPCVGVCGYMCGHVWFMCVPCVFHV